MPEPQTHQPKPYAPTAADLAAVSSATSAEVAAQSSFAVSDSLKALPSLVICSIWPDKLVSKPLPREGRGRVIYEIAPGSMTKPSYVRVYTTWDLVKSGVGDAGQPPTMTQGWIPASLEAENLVRYWCGDHPGNRYGKKGVGIIAGNEATPDELQFLQTTQHRFLQYLVDQADRYWRSNRPNEIEKIGQEHRRALEILQLDIKLHTWYTNVVQVYTVCPWCQNSVNNLAIKCEHCHESISDYFFERPELLDAVAWPRVAEEIERRNKKAGKR